MEEHKAHKESLREAKEKAMSRKAVQPPVNALSGCFFELTEEEEIEMAKNGGEALWSKFLEKVERGKGPVLLATLMGSKRYNLQIDGSDLDLVVVYLPSLEDVVGMKPAPQTFKQQDNLRPDFSVHSLEHYCILLAEGDAKSVEILFSNTMTLHRQDKVWRQLFEWRNRFVTKRVILNYIGELKGLKGMKKLEKLVSDNLDGSVINKCAYILMRLIVLAERFLAASSSDSSPVWFETDSDDYKLLMDIRKGQFSSGDLQKMVTTRFSALESSLAASHLPNSVDPSHLTDLQNWYIGLRQSRGNLMTFKSKTTVVAKIPTELAEVVAQLPGSLLYLSRDFRDNSYFGVYSSTIAQKLELFGERGVPSPITNSKSHEVSDIPIYTFYELDRFSDALNRTELSTILLSHDSTRLIYSSTAWSEFDNIRQSLWTHTLLYQLCGYISGRFKACRGKAELLRDGTSGFSNPMTLATLKMSVNLLDFAMSESSHRQPPQGNDLESLRSFLSTLQQLSSISASLVAGSDTPSMDKELSDISQSYTKVFIALRPVLSELLLPEIETTPLEQWFLSCRFESSILDHAVI